MQKPRPQTALLFLTIFLAASEPIQGKGLSKSHQSWQETFHHPFKGHQTDLKEMD